MRFHRFIAVVISGLALTTGAMARKDDDHGRCAEQKAFVGLWQAIDSFDGSTQLLSITGSPEGSYDVRLNDTAFTLSCQNQIGFAQGLGSVEHHLLTVELALYCSDLQGSSVLAGTQENEFVLNRENGTIINLNDDPVPAPNIFHRISK